MADGFSIEAAVAYADGFATILDHCEGDLERATTLGDAVLGILTFREQLREHSPRVPRAAVERAFSRVGLSASTAALVIGDYH